MPVKIVNERVHVKRGKISQQQIPQNLFPEIFDISSLYTDRSLPLLKFFNIKNLLHTRNSCFNLKVRLPELSGNTDLFIFINGSKRDMFYQVTGGEYIFKNVNLDNGENLVELFYRIGGKKSTSVCSVIFKEQGNQIGKDNESS